MGGTSDVRKQIDRLIAVSGTKGAVKNYHELDSLLNLQRTQVEANPDSGSESTPGGVYRCRDGRHIQSINHYRSPKHLRE
jgi:hypothetical protein